MDRRITRSLASRVRSSTNDHEPIIDCAPQVQTTTVANNNSSKKQKVVSSTQPRPKYHYEFDIMGRRKRVPNRDHHNNSKHSNQAEVENVMVKVTPNTPEQTGRGSAAEQQEVQKGPRTRTSSSSSPRKRKGSNVNVKVEQGGISGQSSNHAHQQQQRYNHHASNQAKVNSSNSISHDGQHSLAVVKKEKSDRNNHCSRQQQLDQQQQQQQNVMVPKSSSRSSTNHHHNHRNSSNQCSNLHPHPSSLIPQLPSHPQVLNEATNMISKQPGSNKMIPVTITITSDSSEISDTKQRNINGTNNNNNTICQQLVHQQLSTMAAIHGVSGGHRSPVVANNNNNLVLAHNNNTMLSHLDLPSSSNRAMMSTEVGTTGIATGSSPSVSSFDDEDIPEASVDFPKGILSTIKCNGCNKDFFTLDHVPKSDYYFHCFQCPEYCNKNETSRCYDCYSYFIDNESKERHYNLFHSIKALKPGWMPPSMYTKSTLHRSNARIECRGCSEPFGCFVSPISQSSTPSLEYYIHCIEDCSDYKRLQLIATCNTCGFKFMESKSLAGHKPHCTRIFEKSSTLNLSSSSGTPGSGGGVPIVSSSASCYPLMASAVVASIAPNSVQSNLMSSLHVAVSNLNNHYQQQAAAANNHR